MVSINFPPLEIQSVKEEIQVFSGFVKPGRHVIFIFDPETKNFYRKDLVVELRKGPIRFVVAKELKTSESKVPEQVKKISSIFNNPKNIFNKWRVDDDELIHKLVKADL